MTKGKANPHIVARVAATALPISAGSAGLAYGRSLASDRVAGRRAGTAGGAWPGGDSTAGDDVVV
ncbi:MAG TPA: hypothetical protein VES60_04365 [Nakamurella sp.]|nr:hypothetical protein [Nakamurella sp.]